MTLNDVYDFLLDWIDYVLNTRYTLNIQIVIGSQNAPAPDTTYIVIHEPPISNRKVGDAQHIQTYVDEGDNPFTEYSNTWRASINIEEVNSTGSLIEKLINTIQEDSVQDIWNTNKEISLEDISGGSANNSLLGNIIKKRYNMELFLLYTEKTTIPQEIIETVVISERNYT